MENKKTGYPHIDKPWMKYYDGLYIPTDEPKKNLVEIIKGRNKYRKSMPAYEYYGNLVSYDEMFYHNDNASKVLKNLGVKKRDIIVSLVPNISDEEHIFFGANQLGAAVDYIDPRPDFDVLVSAKKLLQTIANDKKKATINGYDIRYIVALDKCYLSMLKPIENELKELGINDVILLNSTDSMGENGLFKYAKDLINYERLAKGETLVSDNVSVDELKKIVTILKQFQDLDYILKQAIKESPLNIYNYSDLVRECENSRFEIVNDPDLLAWIGKTSGTSGGIPKPITMTNKAVASSMMQCDIGGLSPNEGESVLHVLPGFAAFGRFNNGIQTYYSKGVSLHVPEFPLGNFGYLVKDLKPNVIMATPAFLLAMIDSPYLKNEDLSFITKIFYGGDSMSEKDEERLNHFLRSHNCRTKVEQGYGLSETAGGAAYAKGDYNRPNSIGIPLPTTTMSIVDPDIKDRLVPLKFEEGKEKLGGEIVINGGQLTDASFVEPGKIIFQTMPDDGKQYLRTGDVGFMDKDGIFYAQGRKDRGFVRVDGYNVKPYVIEPEIESNKYVMNARIVPYYDENMGGKMPLCHVVLNEKDLTDDEQIKVIEDIVNNTIVKNPNMESRQIPSKFKIRESLPCSTNNKIDFKALEAEELSGDEISVVVHQTNVAIEGIDIFKDKKGIQRKRIK